MFTEDWALTSRKVKTQVIEVTILFGNCDYNVLSGGVTSFKFPDMNRKIRYLYCKYLPIYYNIFTICKSPTFF